VSRRQTPRHTVSVPNRSAAGLYINSTPEGATVGCTGGGDTLLTLPLAAEPADMGKVDAAPLGLTLREPRSTSSAATPSSFWLPSSGGTEEVESPRVQAPGVAILFDHATLA
jgi:hypothetical protein